MKSSIENESAFTKAPFAEEYLGELEQDVTVQEDAEACESHEEALEPEEDDATKLEKLKTFIYAQPLHREIMYRVLGYCRQRRALEDVEQFIMALPEFAGATQSPFFIMEDLRVKGALACIELDENGNDVCNEDKEGLSEDEIDDLVVSFAYENTELGNLAAADCSVSARFTRMLGDTQEHARAYKRVLEMLTEKKGPATIDMLLKQWAASVDFGAQVETSVLLDKLEKSGAIRWCGGWELTAEGKELLLTDD